MANAFEDEVFNYFFVCLQSRGMLKTNKQSKQN